MWYTNHGLYGDLGKYSLLRNIMVHLNCYSMSKVVQLRTGHSALESYFQKRKILKENINMDMADLIQLSTC